MQKTLRVVARVVALPDQIERLKELLTSLVEPTRQEPGCLYYELLQNQQDPKDFTFVEEWESQKHFNAHLASEHLKNAMNQLPGLVAGEPDIRCYDLII